MVSSYSKKWAFSFGKMNFGCRVIQTRINEAVRYTVNVIPYTFGTSNNCFSLYVFPFFDRFLEPKTYTQTILQCNLQSLIMACNNRVNAVHIHQK